MAKRPNFPAIRGFESLPEGRLLNQLVDFDGPVGIAYERSIAYAKPEHSHDRVTITFPRGSSRSYIKTFPEAKTHRLNEGRVHVMAKDHPHEQGSFSAVYDTFALFPTEAHYRKHLVSLGAPVREIDAFLKETATFARKPALDDLVNRYFIARVLRRETGAESRHLEELILTEVFSLGRKRAEKPERAPKPEPLPEEVALGRAIEHIEASLFEKLDVAGIVAASRTSQATLFRLFKRELKASPIEYLRNRRLDEARSLLASGKYQVGDVALLVGYDELSSFSKAFKRRFRRAPSAFAK